MIDAAAPPQIDVNLIFHNAEATLDQAIASVVAQSWTAWRMTLLDDGSTDAGPEIARRWVARDARIRLKTHRANQGIVGAYRRAFVEGDGEFLMPKSADDLLAPEYMAALMAVLLDEPEAAMCHAGAVTIDRDDAPIGVVPAETRLDTPGGGPMQRAAHVMMRYAASPSFWGIYRRAAVDRALPPQPRGGWDHAFLAELALYGHIRHVPACLFLRRDGAAPLVRLARNASLAWSRTRSEEDVFAEPWALVPITACIWAHVEAFSLARIPAEDRAALIEAARDILTRRWSERLVTERSLFAMRLPAWRALAARAGASGASGAALRLDAALDEIERAIAWTAEAAARVPRRGAA